MLSVDEAKERLLLNFQRLDAEIIPVDRAVGRVLAKTVYAAYDLPSFTNSAMDGFGVRTGDVQPAAPENPVILLVVGDIPAGAEPATQLRPGETVRIMTGALVPPSIEAVIPVEDTDFKERQPGTVLPEIVQIFRSVRPGENIRPGGQDVRQGEPVLEPGRRLRPQDAGFLGMLGISKVAVYRKPRVAIFSTGDELTPVGEPLQPGKIYDSNLTMLMGLVERAGGEALNLGIARDTELEVKACLDRATRSGVDLIISTAGVSVGAFDFVRTVVQQEGKLDFWRVHIRPGKPFAFGHYRRVPFFGLPGNPVSAFVSFEVFVRPAICKLTGLTGERLRMRVRLAEPVESDGRESYLRAIVDLTDSPSAHLTGHQGSGNLRSLVQANALLIIPSAVKSVPVGAELEAWLLDVDG